MDMSSMDMSHGMGGMSMGDGVPSPFYLQEMYWAVVGTAIGCACLVNVYNKSLYRQRQAMSAVSRKDPLPSKPRAILPSTISTIYAVVRELTYADYTFVLPRQIRWTSPTLGRLWAVMAELVLVLALCFYRLNPRDQWQWEDLGYRTGFIAAAQLPLVVLLAGKRNIIGWLIGSSYERLNWLHRWVSRILFLTVTIHMGFWFVDWARYDYIKVKLTTDPITQRGFAAWCILLWIVLSSLAPVRRWNYEFFVVQHVVTFAGFFAAVYLHLPQEVKVWIWLPIGLVLFDRLIRAVTYSFINVSILNSKAQSSRLLACTATFEPLSDGTTRIRIDNVPFRWKAGQHAFLACHALAPLQAHPFTIASIPEDGKLEFFVKAKSGGTKRFFHHAERSGNLPKTSADLSPRHGRSVVLEGPYGRIRPLRQFDSVCFIAGSSGATFTMPLMRDIVASWCKHASLEQRTGYHRAAKFQGAATQFIRFIWVIKSRLQYSWFASQLAKVENDVLDLRNKGYDLQVEMSVYITCDDTLNKRGHDGWRSRSPEPVHGAPTEKVPPEDDLTKIEEPKKADVVSVNSVSSAVSSKRGASTSCGPNGTCCCLRTIEDEDQVRDSAPQCQCHCSTIQAKKMIVEVPEEIEPPSTSSLASSETSVDKASVMTQPVSGIPMLSGRPHPRSLIRRMLEQASGESAVVACGPEGLVDDVRQSVVALSDERAVHKGTGAQGIYLHTESFEY
ncbi:MAG: hypothetical protein Q9220_000039 [cf. Caloplaca sp. 1 TL-2023]